MSFIKKLPGPILLPRVQHGVLARGILPGKAVAHGPTRPRTPAVSFGSISKRRKGFPSEKKVKHGVRIVHNTMVNTKGESIGLWWVGGHCYEDMVLENNIFYVARSQNVQAPGLVFSRHNAQQHWLNFDRPGTV